MWTRAGVARRITILSVLCFFFCRNQGPYPVVVAAHPQEQNQFAVGMSDGAVKVIEPLESEGKWGVSQPDE